MKPGRPATVTAAAILLLIIAALNIVGGLAFIGGAGSVANSGAARLVGILDILIGSVQVYAGVKVMALQESGRTVGVVVSAIGAGLAVLAIGQGGVGQIVGLVLNGFILVTLIRQRDSFTR